MRIAERWKYLSEMDTGSLANQEYVSEEKSTELMPADVAVAATERPRKGGARSLLFGAYALLLLWGIAYLVLFFTDRLPS